MAYLRRSRTCNWYVYWVRNNPEVQTWTSENMIVAQNQQHIFIQGRSRVSRSPEESEVFSFAEICRMLEADDFSTIPGLSEADRPLLIAVLRKFVIDVQSEYPLDGIKRERRPSGLYCPHCRRPLSIGGMLGLARMAPAGWLYFHCPECKAQSFIEFSRSEVAIGNFDGFPEPNFIPVSSLRVEKLDVAGYQGGLRVKVGEQEWSFEK